MTCNLKHLHYFLRRKFSYFQSSPKVLQACGDTEREQETVWVCRAAGQESQDKGKEAQMEVLELKLSCIPKIPKTNIHQRGL